MWAKAMTPGSSKLFADSWTIEHPNFAIKSEQVKSEQSYYRSAVDMIAEILSLKSLNLASHLAEA